MTMRRTALVLSALCGLAAPAFAQNALDRNLQQGAGRINPSRPDFASELRFRNAIVTGNSPNGTSFRGNIDYRAPGEFFGGLGSNETFSFRRDSMTSGLGGVGIRGTDALQYQFGMTTGNAPPGGYYGMPIARRSGGGITGQTGRGEQPFAPGGVQTIIPGSSAANVTGNYGGEMLSLRSPSAYVSNRGLQATVMGTTTDEQGQTLGITASSLRGLTLAPLQNPLRDQARALQDQRPNQFGQPAEGEARGEPREPSLLAGPSTAVGGSEDTRLDMRVTTTADSRVSAYDQVLERMRASSQDGAEDPTARRPGAPDSPEEAEATEPEWRQRLTELREQLAQSRMTPSAAEPKEPDVRPPAGPGMEAPPNTGPANEAPGTSGPPNFRPETIEMLRQGGEVKNLAPQGFDAYANAMRTAEQFLADGRYFDAEARFTSALSAKPGDPMAAAGRIHSELGATMFLSAALNLRALLTQNPELAGVRYAPELLPAPDRLPLIRARLLELLAESKGDPENGLLLAYLGYQMKDQAAIRQGLEAIAAVEGREHDSLRRLGRLLQQVWLNPNTAPATPGTSAPNPSPPASPGSPPPPAPPPPVPKK